LKFSPLFFFFCPPRRLLIRLSPLLFFERSHLVLEFLFSDQLATQFFCRFLFVSFRNAKLVSIFYFFILPRINKILLTDIATPHS